MDTFTERELLALGIVEQLEIVHNNVGPLAGNDFVAKDVFDIANHVTGAGNPDWRDSHPPAEKNAMVVESCLSAGAKLIGKSVCDELCYSLDGVNEFYGTPLNAHATERLPGGSSSGSAAAVASGMADFGLGTDTSGSIRVPSSYSGIFGFRPSHGRVSCAGVVPLAPSYDTVGWLTKDASLLELVGRTLLNEGHVDPGRLKLKVFTDAWNLCDRSIQLELPKILGELRPHFFSVEEVSCSPFALVKWSAAYRILQAHEVWQTHGQWIVNRQPQFAPDIQDRFVFASTVSESQVADAQRTRDTALQEIHNSILREYTVLLMPTTWNVAPLRDASAEERGSNRGSNLKLTSLATLCGAPQASVPLTRADGLPFGLSFLMAPQSDMQLLSVIKTVEKSLIPPEQHHHR